jgi:hypothetical protein
MPTSKMHRRARGRPHKREVVEDIDQVIKKLLSDLELFESKREDLWYNDDEVTKEKDGTAHWWEKVDLNILGKGTEFGNKESDASSDGLRSMDGSDSDNVRKKKRYRQFNKKFDLKISISFEVGD